MFSSSNIAAGRSHVESVTMPTRSARFRSKRVSCCDLMSSIFVCAISPKRARVSKSFSGSLVCTCTRTRVAPPAMTTESPVRAASRRRASRSIESPSRSASVQNRKRMDSGVRSNTAARTASGGTGGSARRAASRT